MERRTSAPELNISALHPISSLNGMKIYSTNCARKLTASPWKDLGILYSFAFHCCKSKCRDVMLLALVPLLLTSGSANASDVCSDVLQEKIKFKTHKTDRFRAQLWLTGQVPIECEELNTSMGLTYGCGGNKVFGDLITSKSGHKMQVQMTNFKSWRECISENGHYYLRVWSEWEGPIREAEKYMKFRSYTDQKIQPVMPIF